VDTPAHDTAEGYIFVAPKTDPAYKGAVQNGPMILDDSGEVVWFRPMQGEDVRAMDFKVQRYRGEPVITYYQGVGTTYGRGEYVILDSSYREVTRVRAGNGYVGDHHEVLITPEDTALLTIYSPVSWDLSSVGGPENGAVLDGIAQEIDIETGEVLFEWHSLDHVGIENTYRVLPENEQAPFDYFHINSIDLDLDDNLLVSSRTTFAIYKIDRKTGASSGGWVARRATSRWEKAPGCATSMTRGATRTAPSRSSITAVFTRTTSPMASCSTPTRTR